MSAGTPLSSAASQAHDLVCRGAIMDAACHAVADAIDKRTSIAAALIDAIDAVAPAPERTTIDGKLVLREALIGPGNAEESAATLGRFGWLAALIADLKECPDAMNALQKEDASATIEALAETEALIRDVRRALAATPAPSIGVNREDIARIIDPTAWKVDPDGYLVELVHSDAALAKADAILAALGHNVGASGGRQ